MIDPNWSHAKAVELGQHVLRMTTASGTGHPSSGLAIAHIVIELMYRTMRYDPADPWNPGNDRLVLSIGHAVPMVYAAYADLGGVVGLDKAHGKKLSLAEVNSLRAQNSVLDGHPNPAEGFPFFDAATGSLGQGLSAAAGLALAARMDGVGKHIYVIIGDGESREGQVWEAADFIVDHQLHDITAIFSCNGHGQADAVSKQQSAQALAGKLGAFGWAVTEIDGHDPAAVASALGRKSAGKPQAIIARTVKGWGVDLMLKENYHGKPCSAADLEKAVAQLEETGKRLGAKAPTKSTPPGPIAAQARTTGRPIRLPPLRGALERVGLLSAIEKNKLATRVAYGVALVALGDADPRVVALDGDVSNSTFAILFGKQHGSRFFECKIAEQNMITAAVGLAAAGKIPFASSFAKFIARSVDQIDMAMITRANVKIVGSHAGVSLAADGPSQMAVTDIAYFRSMTRVDARSHLADGPAVPACHLFQPSDPVSAYRCTEHMANIHGLCYLRTHRPEAPFLYPLDEQFPLRGVKQLRKGDRVTLVSSGYMLHPVLDAAKRLAERGISCNVFDCYVFPLDPSPIMAAARSAGGSVLTIEDNYVGGLHAELAEAAAAAGDVRVHGLTANRIPKSARTAEEVFSYVGVGLERIMSKAEELARQ